MNSQSDDLQLLFHPSTKTLSSINDITFVKRESLKIFYLNARSLKEKLTELEYLLDELDSRIDVIAVTETWSHQDVEQFMSLRDYQCFFASRSTRRGGGSAVFIHKKIQSRLTRSYCDEYNSIVAVEIGAREKVTLASIYRPPQTLATPVDNFIDLLDDFLAVQHSNTLVFGDFNFDLNSPTKVVEKYRNTVISNGFHFCDNSPTRNEACLDHIITNNIAIGISLQHLQYNLFDHNTIFVEADYTNYTEPNMNEYYLKIHIPAVKEFLRENPISTCLFRDAESNYHSLISRLQEGITRASKRIPIRSNCKHSKPWIDHEMIMLIRTKNYWYSKHRRNPSDEFTRNVFSTWCNTVTNTKRIKRQRYYASRFNSNSGNIVKTWDTIKEVLGNKPKQTQTITQSGKTREDKQRITDEANQYFASVGKHLAEKIPYTAIQPIRELITETLNLETTSTNDVKRTIAELPMSPSIGFDQVQTKIFKLCYDELVEGVKDVVNSSILQSCVPSDLKVSKVVAIPKTPNAKEFSDYRPINIPCVTDKILQKLINKQLVDHLERYSLISSRQYGFRPKSNTQTALFDVVSEIQKHCDTKESVAAIFLDLSKAFDTCDRKILIRKLSEMGVRGRSMQWFRNFFKNRSQFVQDNFVTSSNRYVEHGVIQGSTLGPTLFNCYVNNLKDVSLCGTLFMYADDIVLIYVANSYERLQRNINDDLCVLGDWMNLHKLTVNTGKTKYMLFNVPKCIKLEICYDGNALERVDTFKYLGVWFDSELKWTEHISKLGAKLAQIAGVFKRIGNLLPRNTKRLVYYTLFHSHLVYGILIWGTASKSAIKPLQIIQNKAIKNLFGYHRRTSTAFIHTEHQLLMVENVYTTSACLHIHKILGNAVHSNTVLSRVSQRHQHHTRARANLSINRCNTTRFGKNSVLNKATSRYNNLSEDFKSLAVDNFKLRLKRSLLQNQDFNVPN